MHSVGPLQSRESSSAGRLAPAALALILGLAGCTPAPRPWAPGGVAVTGGPTLPSGPAYRIDPTRSRVRLLVYRSGALARLGHNHVIESHALSGEVHLTAPDTLAGAAFSTTFPVAELIVDAPAARGEEGPEFQVQPSAGDIEGTRRNLLGSPVLDAAAFGTLTVDGTTHATPNGLSATARLLVRGHASTVEVPLSVTPAPRTLTVRGGFSVTQTSLGMTPFSIALGAIAVRDELEVRFEIVAVEAT